MDKTIILATVSLTHDLSETFFDSPCTEIKKIGTLGLVSLIVAVTALARSHVNAGGSGGPMSVAPRTTKKSTDEWEPQEPAEWKEIAMFDAKIRCTDTHLMFLTSSPMGRVGRLDWANAEQQLSKVQVTWHNVLTPILCLYVGTRRGLKIQPGSSGCRKRKKDDIM